MIWLKIARNSNTWLLLDLLEMRLIIWWTRVLFLDLITLDTFEMNLSTSSTSSSIYSIYCIIMYCNIYHQSMFIYRTTSTWDMTWGIWNGITTNQLLIDKCEDPYEHSLAYVILNDLLWISYQFIMTSFVTLTYKYHFTNCSIRNW